MLNYGKILIKKNDGNVADFSLMEVYLGLQQVNDSPMRTLHTYEIVDILDDVLTLLLVKYAELSPDDILNNEYAFEMTEDEIKEVVAKACRGKGYDYMASNYVQHTF